MMAILFRKKEIYLTKVASLENVSISLKTNKLCQLKMLSLVRSVIRKVL